ncbi:ATP-binding protein [Aquiflexum sp. LQ15W]|uniref:sensor histidine kinase n=1 Tax=Cognataquiflexum nitidum TaxID=2922272 RepID=UPI001F12E76C|nr:7TM-DISM domain-containing protein [Cognataquiflexum nitidum]MCH6201272.1 ATP-binding protein [Cognataquiflexum nitidum]
MIAVRIGLASFLVFTFCLIGRWENAFAQTIKSHKIVTPQTEHQPGFLKNWPYFNFWMEDMIYFLEEKEPLEWQEAKAMFHSGDFDLLEGRVFNKGFTESVWWFAFRLENPLDSDITFIFNPYSSSHTTADLFVINESGELLDSFQSGHRVLQKDRPIKYWVVNFELHVPAGEARDFLLRVDTQGRSTFTTFYLDLDWDYWWNEIERGFAYGEIAGRTSLIIFLGIVLLLFFKKRLYLYFALYLTADLIILLDIDNYIFFRYEGEVYLLLGQIILPFFSLIMAFFLINFNLEFFSIRNRQNTIYHSFNAWKKVLTVLAVLVLTTLAYPDWFGLKILIYEAAILVTMATLLAVLWLCILQYRYHRNEALFALGAHFFLSGGMIFYYISILGWYEAHPLEMYFQGYGGLFHAAILMVGMVYQYHRTQKEKDKIAQEQINTEREILKHSIQAQENERHRIAKDLHDDLGGNLALIKLKMELFADKNLGNGYKAEFEDLVSMMEDSCKDLRYISYELMPSDFSSKVLRTMIEELLEKINSQKKLHFSYEVGDFPPLNMDVKINIFRIIKELTNNILKHSQATQAKIKLELDEDSNELKLLVEDNGRGIPKEILDGKVTGMGLSNLKSRVSFLNGRLDIRSSGLGTRVSIWVPVVGERSGSVN